MARITDYATLVTAVGDYLARSDLTTFIPNFVQNTEEKLYGTLKLRAMETALSGSIASGVLAVPADYIELKYAYLTTTPVTFLERTVPELIFTKYSTRSASGRPLEIAREASNFIFGPYPDDTYTVQGIYYAKLPALSVSNTTNWFTSNAPELLLYGALLEAQPFLMNDKRIPTWQMFFDLSVERVARQEKREKGSGSTLATRTA
jgi:hypothetical protein